MDNEVGVIGGSKGIRISDLMQKLASVKPNEEIVKMLELEEINMSNLTEIKNKKFVEGLKKFKRIEN